MILFSSNKRKLPPFFLFNAYRKDCWFLINKLKFLRHNRPRNKLNLILSKTISLNALLREYFGKHKISKQLDIRGVSLDRSHWFTYVAFPSLKNTQLMVNSRSAFTIFLDVGLSDSVKLCCVGSIDAYFLMLMLADASTRFLPI